MSSLINQMANSNLAGPGFVPPAKAGLKRFPFVFLIDVSHSTGLEPDPDINHINAAMSMLADNFINPLPSSELAGCVDQIDVCVIAYSREAEVIQPWSLARNLSPSFNLTPQTTTHTGAGIKAALAQIAGRLRYYQDPANRFAFGMPHIIHLTDGAMTDMHPGSPLWNEITQQLRSLNGAANPEVLQLQLLHFVSPKGCDHDRIDLGGRTLTGKQLLAELSGPETVKDMSGQISTFEDLITLITVVITRITKNFDTKTAMSDALANKNDSSGFSLEDTAFPE